MDTVFLVVPALIFLPVTLLVIIVSGLIEGRRSPSKPLCGTTEFENCEQENYELTNIPEYHPAKKPIKEGWAIVEDAVVTILTGYADANYFQLRNNRFFHFLYEHEVIQQLVCGSCREQGCLRTRWNDEPCPCCGRNDVAYANYSVEDPNYRSGFFVC